MRPRLDSVLIVRLSAIGDVLHALPVLEALRHCLPEARLGWVVEELSAPLLIGNPCLDKLYVIPKKRWKKNLVGSLLSEIVPFARQVRADGWDAAVDLQGLFKSGLAARVSGSRVRVGFGDDAAREMNPVFTTLRVTPAPETRHVVERNLSLLHALGLEPPMDVRGRIGLEEDEKETMRERLYGEETPAASESLVALNPGAGWASKKWEPAKYARVGTILWRERQLQPLVVWGPGEEDLRDEVAAGLEAEKVPHLVAPKTSVRELAALIALCDLFIGGDTGPSHLAAVLDVPVVSIFGASDGHRNRPWPIEAGPMIQREELGCVPCWKTACPLTGEAWMACLRGLEPKTVAEKALEVLAGSAAG